MVLPQLIKSPYKFLRVLRSGNILQDFFPEVAEFFFGDDAAGGKQAVVFALPDVIKGGGVKAVALVKVAAAVPAFEFFGVLGIFFDFNIDDDARVGVLPADGLQNLRAVPAAAQFGHDGEIDDVRDVAV